MGCQVVQKQDFGKICSIPHDKIDEVYGQAFGPDIIFACKVPKNAFVLASRFVTQISDFKTSANGTWSVFSGLYKYKDGNEARQIISREGKKIVQQIR